MNGTDNKDARKPTTPPPPAARQDDDGGDFDDWDDGSEAEETAVMPAELVRQMIKRPQRGGGTGS